MVETSRSSRFLVVSPAEGAAKKLPKSKQCPKKISSVLWALRSCLCGCCCCSSCTSCSSCTTCASAAPPNASGDHNDEPPKEELHRAANSGPSKASKKKKKKKGSTSPSLDPLLKVLPPAMPSPSSPMSLYDDPFSFFTGSSSTYDNTEGTSSFNRGLMGLMEGLATCRKPPTPGPLVPEKSFPVSQQAAKVTDSQIDFFKMLDERIENGPDDESLDETRSKLFSRSTSEYEARHVLPPIAGTHPAALHRRWSASKITNPRTPSSPEEPGGSSMRVSDLEEEEEATAARSVSAPAPVSREPTSAHGAVLETSS